MVIVNTVVIVREGLARPNSAVSIALACFGAGSMLMAFMLPQFLKRHSERSVMLIAGIRTDTRLDRARNSLALVGDHHALASLAAGLVLGVAYSALVTPGGLLLRRSSREADRPALFAAQFSLRHASFPYKGVTKATQGSREAHANFDFLAGKHCDNAAPAVFARTAHLSLSHGRQCQFILLINLNQPDLGG